jgi:2,4-dienoyl-CoA reductase-like NADH-dependent reductase (Old Yellow Enzyme family)/thioredoxin reductase
MNEAKIFYPHLFSEGRIGDLVLKNRIISSPMEKNLGNSDGFVTQRYLEYVRDRARGGAALICPEDLYVDPRGKGNMLQLGIHDDAAIPGLHRLCAAVKDEGAAVLAEINHGGRQAQSAASGLQPVAPSPIPFEGFRRGEMPRELTQEEIEQIVASYAAAAERARVAGFDAVMIHGAHGYLLNQFFSPRSNQRKDEYGGSLEGRMRFPLEVVKSVRHVLGNDYPLMYRLTAVEGLEGGLEWNDVLALCQALEIAGIVHIDVSAGTYESSDLITPSMEGPIAPNADTAERIKNHVGISVSVVGRIMDADTAEEIVRTGKADFVTMARALHADPYLPLKSQQGRTDEVRPCVGCLKCIDLLGMGEPVLCMVNSHTGQEGETRITPAPASKRVVIVGGGPAGLEAARVAALRGHRVTLMEMSGELGGQVRYAAKAPGRTDLVLAVRSLEAEIRRLEVEICLWTLAEPETIRQLAPDEVVLATGAMASSSGIPGEETAEILDPLDAMANGWDGNGRALVFGGLMRGCSVAGRLAEMGGEVVLVEPGDEWIADLGPRARAPMLRTLLSLENLKLYLRTYLERIDVGEALLRGKTVKDTLVTDIRFIVPTRTMLSQTGLHASLTVEMPDLPVRTVGDCKRPRGVFEAIQEGAAAARQI